MVNTNKNFPDNEKVNGAGEAISVWGRPRKSNTSKIIVAFLLLFLVAAGGGFYFYYFVLQSDKETPNVVLEYSKPPTVFLGKPFEVKISLSNYSSEVILKNASLSLILPEGVSFLGQDQSKRVVEEFIGDLGPGSINQQGFNLIITEGANSVKRIKANLTYSTNLNSQLRFSSEKDIDISVGESVVSLTLSAPQKILSGEDFEINVRYYNNAPEEIKNIKFVAQYPSAFTFKRSSLEPENSNNNSWVIGDLRRGGSGDFTIIGNIISQEGAFFELKGYLLAEFGGQIYTLSEQKLPFVISVAPLSLRLSINGKDENYIADLSEALRYNIIYKNNSNAVFQNINITVKLVGELFDFATLNTNGAFDSVKNIIFWTPANDRRLTTLAPGEEKIISFEIKTKGNYPIRRLSDKNFTLKVHAQIESPTVPAGVAAQKTISMASLENKIRGKIELEAKALFRDAYSGVLNTGPYPPKVNEPTRYTIHWRLINYSTDVGNIVVSAYLQSNTRFISAIKSTAGSLPSYDARTGKVSWIIDKLSATKGVIDQPAEAIFQVENTPAITDLNKYVTFLSESRAEAKDLFTNLNLFSTARSLNTNLPDDEEAGGYNRSVRP